ncbi:MAG TPA: UDP-N-acetylmuramoyl-L-alanyl-D-glutamate--2,6-diaminopimelate ligase [Micropepsaceae bacterium]|nr:UDP-N-acetylmuramoyl-L-alanyl-D-glutamate--2,6-diaminopimelate ligase [Micropepsaceae bacterium]
MGETKIVDMGVQGFRGLTADSREVKPGFLFAALSGTKIDGSRFIEDAVKRGAAAILAAPEAAPLAKKLGIPFIAAANPRRRLAQMAAEFYGAQPQGIAAVTGTNGKTSVASFLRQIWTFQGRRAASLGTVGIDSPSGHVSLGLTTPDPVRLHAELSRLKREGVDHLALEASSHGLDQYRLDGVEISAAGFTNITRDHLDYHTSFADYLAAKLRLFTDLVKDGGVAVVNVDSVHAEDFIAAAKRRRLKLLTVGVHGEDLRLIAQMPHASGQELTVLYQGREHKIALPLAGSFQASNAAVSAGLALALGDPAETVFAALATLKGAPGRLELVARTRQNAPIYVDYAHTPDAIETVLKALRPHVKERLHIVFGCGGDRDRGKRPLMAAAARRFADDVIVTDDNPRSEDPAAIRREVLAGAPDAREIAGRAEAIHYAVGQLGENDALVLAGKGHEDYQIIGAEVHPFSDRGEAVKAAIASGGIAVGDAA